MLDLTSTSERSALLFNSYTFLLVFLPITLIGYRWIRGRGRDELRPGLAWLVTASFIFYGYWKPVYLLLLVGSILGNFSIGLLMGRLDPNRAGWRQGILILGIAANLGALAYFKYLGFFSELFFDLIGRPYETLAIALPLAISFFTFQQISYLVDLYEGEAPRVDLLEYTLFVTFFPQLIAGPIVHHREIMPQFGNAWDRERADRDLAIGLPYFFGGLFKKVVIADQLALYATPVFGQAQDGLTPWSLTAWIAALAYTGQLYFDFSGYSDMAIGLGRMFGIRLPLNFNSPYKATNIIDFWRRWHITLSRFLRDYLYIPLGGNRRGVARRYLNLMITMLLGGLWHGAGWNFVIWGGLHGSYLCLNHGWNTIARRFGRRPEDVGWFGRSASWALTFLAVVVCWVIFRAESWGAAVRMLQAMALISPESRSLDGAPPIDLIEASVVTFLALMVAWFTPNLAQIFDGDRVEESNTPPTEGVEPLGQTWDWLRWRPTPLTAIVGVVVAITAILYIGRASEFLYFQF